MTKVFISHSTKDSSFARNKLKTFLEHYGIETWFSDSDIPTAADWERGIRKALSDAQWYIVILSPDSVKSEWVQAEVHWALEKRKGHVIPIMIRDCDPGELHLKLLRIQYLDFRKDPEAAAAKLLHVLRSGSLPGGDAPLVREESEEEKTILLHPTEALVCLQTIAGPQKGSALTVRLHGDCVIGRGRDAGVRVLDDCVSRRHAKFPVSSRKGGAELLLTDLGSANGTYVNGSRITAPTFLEKKDVIQLGGTRILLEEVT